MSFQYTFFDTAIRYVTACGQHPNAPSALSINSTCSQNDNNGSINITWGVLQSTVALVLWVCCALIGLRARRGSVSMFPATIALYVAIGMIVHGIFQARSWTPGFYVEVGCWSGAFFVALLFYMFDVERIPLGSFVFTSIAAGCCMIVEYIKPGSFSNISDDSDNDDGNLNTASLCAIAACPLAFGAVIGGVCCRKKRLRSGSVFSSLASGLDEDGTYQHEGSGIDSVRYGGGGHIALHLLNGSIGQAFIVAPLVFAACKFEGCPAIWQLGDCHQESYDAALAVSITTFASTAVVGFIVQCCWAYRSTRETADRNFVNPELSQHFASTGATDVAGDDLASRGILKGQTTPHLDNRWTRMVQDGY